MNGQSLYALVASIYSTNETPMNEAQVFKIFNEVILDNATCQAKTPAQKDKYYLDNNTDVANPLKWGGTALEHWNEHGKNENRVNCYQ